MLPWTGYYINLDRSPERRQSIERQLASMELSPAYSRFPAIDGAKLTPVPGLTSAELGCFRSHAEVLRAARPQASRFIHVLEDDAVLSASFVEVLGRFIQSGALDEFDLVFTDVIPFDLSIGSIRKLKSAYDASGRGVAQRFNLIDLRGFEFAGANSYLVNTKSVPKISEITRAELSARGRQIAPIDILYRREVHAKRLSAACIFPFISSDHIDLGRRSTIGEHHKFIANGLLRHAFFVDCDIHAVSAALARVNLPTATDRHMDILANIYRLTLGPDERPHPSHS